MHGLAEATARGKHVNLEYMYILYIVHVHVVLRHVGCGKVGVECTTGVSVCVGVVQGSHLNCYYYLVPEGTLMLEQSVGGGTAAV